MTPPPVTPHLHAWAPIQGERGRYLCDCGVTGYRNRAGEIVAYRQPPRRARPPTARPITLRGERVPPRLHEDWESWERKQ